VDILLCQKERTLEEEALLDLWSILIEEFEERYNFPDTQGDEVEVLVCLMDAHSMTQADLVSKLNLGSSRVVSQILNRKRGISKTQAKKLANYFHGDASLFI
jgi:HTH-type transcriptional regulator/antitoxin HigA